MRTLEKQFDELWLAKNCTTIEDTLHYMPRSRMVHPLWFIHEEFMGSCLLHTNTISHLTRCKIKLCHRIQNRFAYPNDFLRLGLGYYTCLI